MLDLDSVIAATGELKPLPATTLRLSQMLAHPDVDLREVAKVVMLDAPLTARVLRTANSALYVGKVSISSVDQAVTRLGSGIILSIAFSAALKRELMGGLPGYGMSEGELWRRSIASAIAAESVKAVATKVTVPPVAYTSALLHDIGRLVLARFLDQQAKELLAEAHTAEPSRDDEAIEQQIFGVHHAELGAIIAQRWNLPSVIVHAIEYFHCPDQGAQRLREYEDPSDSAQLDATCDAVHIADAVARLLTAGEPDALAKVEAGALARLGLDATALTRIVDRTRQRLDETLTLFS